MLEWIVPQRWSRLRWLESSRVIQTSYVWLFAVPALAKLLETLESPVVIKAVAPEWVLTLELPFSWKLFYFSAAAFFVGTLIYLARCPRLIREHANLGDFERQGKSLLELIQYDDEIGGKQDFKPYAVPPGDWTRDLGVAQRQARQEFWPVWRRADQLRPLARGVVSLCYGIGLALAAIVVIQNLVFVVKAL